MAKKKTNEKTRIYMKNRASALFVDSIYEYLYIDRSSLQWMQGNIYREVFPTFLSKKSYGWWITRRRMEIYTKYLKKRSKRVGAQISGSTKDHFAGENEVCKIS